MARRRSSTRSIGRQRNLGATLLAVLVLALLTVLGPRFIPGLRLPTPPGKSAPLSQPGAPGEPASPAPWPPLPEDLSEGLHRVERVVDGDTLILSGGVTVRLIGADTPETVKPNHPVEPFGPEATRFTQQFVSGGEVRIEFDGDRRDRYGRALALVSVGDRMLNEELLRAGLARARTNYNYSQATKARFLLAEGEARQARRGLWGNQPALAP